MGSLGRIGLTGGILLFVFFGIMTIVRSCDADRDGVGEVGLIETSEEYDIFSDADDVVLPDNSVDETMENDTDTGSGEIDYTVVDEELEKPLTKEEEERLIKVVKPDTKKKTATKPKKTPTKKKAVPVAGGGSAGKYLVVAGSFAVRDNAVKSVKKLKSKGYDAAKVVQFDNRNLHVVCAYQSDDYDAVAKVVKSLKAKGIDCYIKTKS